MIHHKREHGGSRRHEVKKYSVKVRDIMATKVLTVSPMTPYHEIVTLLLDHDISGLPVVDSEGTLLGIVSEADLISKEAYDEAPRRHLGFLRDHVAGRDTEWVRKAAARHAQELMTSPVQSIAPDEDLSTAARMMLEGHLKRLPVLEDGKLVGIIARHDLLRPFSRTDEDIAADVAAILADPMRSPESHEVVFTVREGVVLLKGTTRIPSDADVIVAFLAGVPGVVAIEDGIGARDDAPVVEPTFLPGATER
jgi:CBS-domain-containing membrane protein